MLLQLIPGSDTVLHLAIAHGSSWRTGGRTGSSSSNGSPTPGKSTPAWAGGRETHPGSGEPPGAAWAPTSRDTGSGCSSSATPILDEAERTTGVPREQIIQAAEMLARPVDGRRPKTSFGLEKGNYWSNNYGNTASFAALALICGAGNRPGQVVSRLGGHQRGWMGAAPYPIDKSPHQLPGRRRQEIDLDRWVEAGEVTVRMGHRHDLDQRHGGIAGTPRNLRADDHRQRAPGILHQRGGSGGGPDPAGRQWRNGHCRPGHLPPVTHRRRTGRHRAARRHLGRARLHALQRGAEAAAVLEVQRPARATRARTGGSSGSSPRGWGSQVTTGRTPTRCSRSPRGPAGAGCWTTMP